ncbi:50S ribosomal protein L5 [Candidatus Woesearchaeota archaeon]|nr:50S ribosomal protein L5 [Candidatus Woesearchaeota archaeon]
MKTTTANTTNPINPMTRIRVEKVTLNIGAGKDQQKLEKGVALLKYLTGIPPVKCITQKRIPTWGLRPGLPIGCKLTLRGEKAIDFLKRSLVAKEKMLSLKNFDERGTVSFGVPEYIDVEGVKYNPEIGTTGFEIAVTLERPGFHVKKRRVRASRIGGDHNITKEESIKFFTENFKIKIKEMEAAV